jgi:tellurite resistance protein TehA-like permease
MWRVIWLLVWAAWFPIAVVVLLVVDPLPKDVAAVVWIFAVPAGVGLIATVSWGFALGRLRLWRDLRLSIWLGAAVLLAGFVVASGIGAAASDPQSGADDGAAVGLLLISIPVVTVVATALTLGAGIARLGQGVHQRLRH